MPFDILLTTLVMTPKIDGKSESLPGRRDSRTIYTLQRTFNVLIMFAVRSSHDIVVSFKEFRSMSATIVSLRKTKDKNTVTEYDFLSPESTGSRQTAIHNAPRRNNGP